MFKTINAINWLIRGVLLFAFKYQNVLMKLSKICYCDSHFRLPMVLHFYQFMRNEFLGKVKLNQGKVIFRLTLFKKAPGRGGAYMRLSPRVKYE